MRAPVMSDLLGMVKHGPNDEFDQIQIRLASPELIRSW